MFRICKLLIIEIAILMVILVIALWRRPEGMVSAQEYAGQPSAIRYQGARVPGGTVLASNHERVTRF